MNSRPIHKALAVVLFGVVCCVCVLGCGGGTGDVSGKVTLNGTPLKGGTVNFIPVGGEGPSFSTEINEDGSYTMMGVRSGEYKVCVETEYLRAKGAGQPAGGPGGSSSKSGKFGPPAGSSGPPDVAKAIKEGKIKTGAPPGGSEEPEDVKAKRGKDGFAYMADNAKRYVAIPTQYASPDTTDLSFKAGSGSQSFDIPLKGK